MRRVLVTGWLEIEVDGRRALEHAESALLDAGFDPILYTEEKLVVDVRDKVDLQMTSHKHTLFTLKPDEFYPNSLRDEDGPILKGDDLIAALRRSEPPCDEC